jgi:hypothetical protein
MTYASAPSEFAVYDLVFIAFLLAVVFALETGICLLFLKNVVLANFVISIFIVINIVSLHLIASSDFINLDISIIGLSLLLEFFIVFSLLNVFDGHAKLSTLILSTTIVSTVGIVIYEEIRLDADDKQRVTKSMSSAENIRLVKFDSKPNVYIVSFDSLIPEVLLKQYLQLDSTAYHEVLDLHFKRFPNFFADEVPSRPALNMILALDKEYYASLPNQESQFGIFQGFTPSPLFEIFKYNGYETNTIYNSQYFGKEKGPFLDNYYVNLNLSLCEFISGFQKDYFIFGYCNLIETRFVRKILRGLGWKKTADRVDFLLETRQSGIDRQIPQVYLAYTHLLNSKSLLILNVPVLVMVVIYGFSLKKIFQRSKPEN